MSIETKPPLSQSARWYAVKCLSHRVHVAATHLRNQGFRVFLPLAQGTRRHARKTESVLAPFFPSYLFVQMDLSKDRWRSVNGTCGVSRLVMQGDLPVPVLAGIVERLQACCDGREVLTRLEGLKPGQPVRIVVGALADFIGELERQDAADRVRVLLEFMGGRISVGLSRTHIVPAGVPV